MHTNRMRKSQVLSPDFTMSLIIFTAILFLSYTVWNTSQEKSMRFYDTKQMQKKALYISDTLMNTPGIPPDWNTSNIQMAGLKKVDSNTLDIDKVVNFKLLEYNQSKDVLGAGSYEYYFEIMDSNDSVLKVGGGVSGTAAIFATTGADNSIKDLLADYYLDWDYYWAGPGSPSNNARYIYNKSYVTPSTENELFSALISNISSYDTLIIEGTNSLTITAAHETALQDFVSLGGTLIDIQDKSDAQLINHFAVVPDGETAVAGDITGTIIDYDVLFAGRDVGESITFETKKYRFNKSDVDKTIVESNGDSDKCIVCLWYYGNGKIYYMPDGNDGTGNPIQGTDMNGIELVFGNNNTHQTDNLVPIRRIVTVMDGQIPRIGILNLYIYN